jgi:hypothetical protein
VAKWEDLSLGSGMERSAFIGSRATWVGSGEEAAMAQVGENNSEPSSGDGPVMCQKWSPGLTGQGRGGREADR